MQMLWARLFDAHAAACCGDVGGALAHSALLPLLGAEMRAYQRGLADFVNASVDGPPDADAVERYRAVYTATLGWVTRLERADTEHRPQTLHRQERADTS